MSRRDRDCKPGRIRSAIRRKRKAVLRPARPYLLSLAAVAVAALTLALAAPGLLAFLLLPVGGILGLAADRLREHWGWHRSGGKAALRKRRRYQGKATMSELTRNLPDSDGVLIGTVHGGSSW